MSRLTRDIYFESVTLPRWVGCLGFLPLLVLLGCGGRIVPWILMCGLALGLWVGFKWLTLWEEFATHGWFDCKRLQAYLLWPGMNVHRFLHGTVEKRNAPGTAEWAWAAGKIALGAMLLWGIARLAPGPLAAGWIGMVGAIFLLHFGLFHLLALCLRRNGIPAEPLMNAPVCATSLTDFWGRRWNTAFNELTHRYVFAPACRRFGVGGATLLGFLFSGVLHDLVISVPARAGYGLPTLYFLAQAGGVLVQRSRFGGALQLGEGWRGWMFTAFVTAAPAFWLFHPPFVHRVIVPMMEAIGAL